MSLISDKGAKREILRLLHEGSRPYVMSIDWLTDIDDPGSRLHRASCFALKVGNHTFGVTAAHVVCRYQIDHQREEGLCLRLGGLPFDLTLIDIGTTADIATFEITEHAVHEREKEVLLCEQSEWPPAPPDAGSGIVVTGYPKDYQVVETDAEGNLEDVIHQVSNRLIATTVVPRNVSFEVQGEYLEPVGEEEIPPLSLDIGGYSGAPVLTESARLGELFRLGGVLYEGRRWKNDGSDFIAFKAEPMSAISSSGRILGGSTT